MWAKIVLNLLSNALKFTFEGGITVRVAGRRRRCAPDGRRHRHRHRRGRPGRALRALPPRRGRALAQPRGLGHRPRPGRRAGRAARRRRRGGEHAGQGSRFSVRSARSAPRTSPPTRSSRATERDVSVRQQAEGFLAEAMRWLGDEDGGRRPRCVDGPRVLVVDDNADMRDYIASLLADRYAVETAPDGAVALELARREPARPRADRRDDAQPRRLRAAARRCRRTRRRPRVPVVMLSARAGEEGTIEGLEAGADDYLIKPFAARELLARVRANLELDRVRRTRDQLRRSQDLLDQAQRLAARRQLGDRPRDRRDHRRPTSSRASSSCRAEELRDAGPRGRDRAARAPRRRGAASARRSRPRPDGRAAGLRGAARAARRRRPAGSARIGELERDEDGAPAAPARQSTQDITEQRAAEQALAAAAAAARGRRARAPDRRRAAAQPAARPHASTPTTSRSRPTTEPGVAGRRSAATGTT